MPAVRKSGSIKPVRSSSQMRAVRGSSSKLSSVRKSSGFGAAEPESDLFRAMLPPMEGGELQQLKDELANLRRLQEVIHFLGSATDPHSLRTEILDLAISLSGLSRGFLALPTSSKSSKRRYKIKERRGHEATPTRENKVLRGILNRSLERRETLLEGAMAEGGILDHAASGEDLDLGAVASLPLEANGELWGCLLLDDPERTEPFRPAEESLLRSFARHAGLALARLHKQGQQKKRLTQVSRKNERLEAERDLLEQRAKRASRRSGRSSSEVHDRGVEKSGRALQRMLEADYNEAKEQFTRAYLRTLIERSQNDLRVAADEAGLPLNRLIGLLEQLGLSPRLERPKRSRKTHQSTASRSL